MPRETGTSFQATGSSSPQFEAGSEKAVGAWGGGGGAPEDLLWESLWDVSRPKPKVWPRKVLRSCRASPGGNPRDGDKVYGRAKLRLGHRHKQQAWLGT